MMIGNDAIFQRFIREVARAHRLGGEMEPETVECHLYDPECLVMGLNADGSPVCWAGFDRPKEWTRVHEFEAARVFQTCLEFGKKYSELADVGVVQPV